MNGSLPEITDDPPPEKREPLAGLHLYEPVPTATLFPMWESISRFGWVGALAVAGFVGYLLWSKRTRQNTDKMTTPR